MSPTEADAATSAVTAIDAQETQLRGIIDKIRQRADLTGKAIGGIGTSIVTALGIAKFGDVFPLPSMTTPVVLSLAGLGGGFVLMLLAVAFFTVRLWKVNEPIEMRSSLSWMKERLGTDDKAYELVENLYSESAQLNGVPSLSAYEARAGRLDRIAEIADDDTAKELRDTATVIKAEVGLQLARAATDIVRDRAARTIRGWSAAVVGAAFLIGAGAFGIGADYLQSERADKVALAKSCGEARKAGANPKELPRLCDDKAAEVEEPATEFDKSSAQVSELMDSLVSCHSRFEKDGRAQLCNAIRATLSKALQGL